MSFGLFDTEYSPLFPANMQNNQLLAAKFFDDMNILKLFIRFSHFS